MRVIQRTSTSLSDTSKWLQKWPRYAVHWLQTEFKWPGRFSSKKKDILGMLWNELLSRWGQKDSTWGCSLCVRLIAAKGIFDLQVIFERFSRRRGCSKKGLNQWLSRAWIDSKLLGKRNQCGLIYFSVLPRTCHQICTPINTTDLGYAPNKECLFIMQQEEGLCWYWAGKQDSVIECLLWLGKVDGREPSRRPRLRREAMQARLQVAYPHQGLDIICEWWRTEWAIMPYVCQ